VPSSTKSGDYIFLLRSCPVLFVLRATSESRGEQDEAADMDEKLSDISGPKQPHVVHLNLIGECYVDGCMHEGCFPREARRLVPYEEYEKLLVIS